MIAFGPVPSRRLGRSLGINHIPPKVCTYSCVYCQVGRTDRLRVRRGAFYRPEEVRDAVGGSLARALEAGERVDYLSFVPEGEPTLDIHLGRTMALLRPLGRPIAVLSNASLIGQEDVRADLLGADWVSLKVDAVDEEAWRQVNRPHRRLSLAAILEGALEFARLFRGTLTTETMLVAGVNDGAEQVEAVAHFLARLRPAVAYLAVPTRPPAEAWVRPPSEESLARAYQSLSAALGRVELLLGQEGGSFATTGNVEEDLLNITAVHPMRRQAVEELLARAGADWEVVRRLIACGALVETCYDGQWFYMRRLRAPRRAGAGK